MAEGTPDAPNQWCGEPWCPAQWLIVSSEIAVGSGTLIAVPDSPIGPFAYHLKWVRNGRALYVYQPTPVLKGATPETAG